MDELKLKKDEKHLFAFFCPDVFFETPIIGSELCLKQLHVVHRILHVVKLKTYEKCVVFNQEYHMLVEIVFCDKKSIKVRVLEYNTNKEYEPRVTFLLPILKKEALEESVYSLTEIAVNNIQLIVTEKSRRNLFSDKDMVRLQNVIIASAEQSKVYRYPNILKPIFLQEVFESIPDASFRILFDQSGESFFDIKNRLLDNIYLTLGPEWGFTSQEIELLKKNKFASCALTPTVLRSLQAVAIGSALFRLLS